MIAAWMVYGTAVTAAVALAALAAERALLLYRLPVRAVWLASILAGLILPAFAVLLPAGTAGGSGSPLGVLLPTVAVTPSGALTRVGTLADSLDAVLLSLWGLTSIVLLASLGGSLLRLRREGARWGRRDVAGWPVLVSPDLGPALVGVSSGSIVVPPWFFDLPAETQRLALLHEREHLEAGDTRLLAIGLGVAALVPWNVVIWWQVHRFRAAVELDCDHRVLRAGVSPRLYATVLLDVGERSRPVALLRPALAEPKSLLSRRIGAMFTKRIRARGLSAVGYAAAAALLLMVACEAPAPERAAQDPTGVPTGAVASGEVFPEGAAGLEPPERASFPTPAYPKLLLEAGVEGRVLSRFIVGTDGRAEPGSIEILHASHGAFEAPVLHAIENALFRPGRMNGEAVRVQVQMPLRFVPSPSAGPRRAGSMGQR